MQESTIRDFEILTKLGEGSFSMVYKVKRISDGKIYAMKKVKMNSLSAKERENALNEIRILASLSSPYIVEYKDSFLDPDSQILCVIMEFASGGDLNKLLNEGKLKGGVDEVELWRALTQMTLGLKNLHDLKILHRDLKCANVFVMSTPQGNIYKLGDLNISKVTKGAAAKTQAGTPYYAAPEVWRGDTYSSPCDIWSLGCILYELAATRPPFRANDLQGLNNRIQKGVFDPLPAKYSKDFANIVSSMLKLTPGMRPTCAQILNNPVVIKNSGALLVEQPETGKEMLLQTIKLPRNLNMLKGNLPKAKYDDNVAYNRANSAGPRRIDQPVVQTPQPQKSKIQIPQPQPQQQQQQMQQQARPPVPMSSRPPTSNPQKPPTNQKQDYASLEQKIRIQEQRIMGAPPVPADRQNNHRAPSPSNSRQQANQYPYKYNQPAGVPSGMGRRQNSAHQVGRR